MIICHSIKCDTIISNDNKNFNIYKNHVYTTLKNIEKEFKIKPHDFQYQDILLIIDKNYGISEFIGIQIRYFLEYLKSNTNKLEFKEISLKTSIFSKEHCEKLYRIIGKPANNKTFIIVSGSPFVCKKFAVIGNYFYFSANPVPVPLSKLIQVDNYYNDNSASNQMEIGNTTIFNMPSIYNSSKLDRKVFMGNKKSNKNSTQIICNIYEGAENNNIDVDELDSLILSSLSENLDENGNKKYYKLNYAFNKATNLYNYDSKQDCACIYRNFDIFYCKKTINNDIFFLKFSENVKNTMKGLFHTNFNDLRILNNDTIYEPLVEYKIHKNKNWEFKNDYDKYINIYMSTEKANLEFYLKIESITKPFIIKNDFLNFARILKFYASNPNNGFVKFRKIRKKERHQYTMYENVVNISDAFYITFFCFFILGFLSSIIFFRQQRTLTLKKIVVIENIDYDCIELQCHVTSVCTEKELTLIQRAVKLETENKKQPTSIKDKKNKIK